MTHERLLSRLSGMGGHLPHTSPRTAGFRQHTKKSASLRQHTLDDQPSCRHTGNVMTMSSGIFGLRYTSWTTDIGNAGGNVGPPAPVAGDFSLPHRSVVLRISICNAICNSFSRPLCGL